MATNNAGHLIDDAGNVAVDFVWGNFPMQPNDDRDEATQGDLSATGDNHVIAYAGWNGYPLYTPNSVGAGVGNVNVPNVIGKVTANAQDIMDDAGLTVTVASGATNSSKSISAASRTLGSNTLTLTTGSAHGYSAGQLVTISSVHADANGTWVVSGGSGTTLTVGTTPTTALSLTGLSGAVVAVSGTIKTQSVAAGAATIAIGQAVTLTPWA